MLSQVHKSYKIKIFLNVCDQKSNFYIGTRFQAAAATSKTENTEGTKLPTDNKPSKMSYSSKMKQYYRNKIEHFKSMPIRFMQKQFITFWKMNNKVTSAQREMFALEDKLKTVQVRRRSLQFELNEMRKIGKQIQIDKSECNRSDVKYLHLVKKEIETNRAEQEKNEQFEIADAEERVLFYHFSAAVKNTYDEERKHFNTVKNSAALLALLGVVSFILVALSNRYKNKDMATIKSQLDDISIKVNTNQEKESWGQYIPRKLGGAYRYFIPK